MAELKLGTSTIKQYQGNSQGGMMLNHRYVNKIYLGSTLIWEDSNAPTVSEILQNQVGWVEDRFPTLYSFKSVHPETSPWGVSGGTSEEYEMDYPMIVEYKYSDGTTHYFWDKADSALAKYFVGTLYLNDVAQDGYLKVSTTYSKYTIPENTKPYGLSYTICKKSQSGDMGKKTFIEYQTSDEHALFGLSSDVFGNMHYSSARDYLTRSDSTYSVSQAGTLVFRPLKRCQINFSNTGYYFYDTSSKTISGLNSTLQNEKSLTSLPGSLDDLLTDTFKNAGFETLPNNLVLDTNTTLLVGFLEEGTFWFSSVFSPDKTNITLNSAGGSETITIYADDDINWTASPSDSWITVSKTSGTGESSVVISSSRNTSESSRIGSVTFTSDDTTFKVWVQQAKYETSLSFGEVPATLSLTSSMSNTWEISEIESHTTSGIEFTQISFVPTKNGTVGLLSMSNFDIDSCDSTLIGTTITQNNTSFDDAEAIAICNTDNSNTYGVIKGNTYYLQIYRADTLSTEFAIGVTLSFNAS